MLPGGVVGRERGRRGGAGGARLPARGLMAGTAVALGVMLGLQVLLGTRVARWESPPGGTVRSLNRLHRSAAGQVQGFLRWAFAGVVSGPGVGPPGRGVARPALLRVGKPWRAGSGDEPPEDAPPLALPRRQEGGGRSGTGQVPGSSPTAGLPRPAHHSAKGKGAEAGGGAGEGGGAEREHKLPVLEGLSSSVAQELELNNGRLEKLMHEKVDIIFSRAAVQSHKQDLTCGGQNIMGFHSLGEMLRAQPQLPSVIPSTDSFGKRKSGTCAVVGNSGSLLGAGHGAEIDGHNTVIRFNKAPTGGYEKDVGRKTTVRLQNVDYLGHHEAQDEHLFFTARSEKDLARYFKLAKKIKKERPKHYHQYLFHPGFWCHLFDWVAHRRLKPSTGLAGVVMALRTCQHPIDLYGFSHDEKQFHYYNNISAKVQEDVHKWHPLLEEAALYRELQTYNMIRLVP